MHLSLEHLNKTYPASPSNVKALVDVSLKVESGHYVALQGPSGCGKSTLLLTAGTMLAPDSGKVELLGTDPYSLTPNDRAAFRAQKIGFIFQQFHLVPYLNVFENIQVASLGLARESKQGSLEIEPLLTRLQLDSRKSHYPSQLSSGEKQRCCVARALLNRPQLILADEPSGSLDDRNAQIIFQVLREFANDGGAVLLVTHDPRAIEFSDRVLKMQAGSIQSEAEANESRAKGEEGSMKDSAGTKIQS